MRHHSHLLGLFELNPVIKNVLNPTVPKDQKKKRNTIYTKFLLYMGPQVVYSNPPVSVSAKHHCCQNYNKGHLHSRYDRSARSSPLLFLLSAISYVGPFLQEE